MDQRYLIAKQICSKIFTNNILEERDRIQLFKEIVRCPLLVRLVLDKIEGTISQDHTQIASIKNIEVALLILLSTSTSLEHYAESLVALIEVIDKASTNHRQLHLTCATLQPSTVVQTRAVLAVILLLERSEQFKASWVDLLIIELRAKINNVIEEQLTLIAHDWLWASKQTSWKNTSNSTKTLFEQTTQLIAKRHPSIPKSIREVSIEEFKIPIGQIRSATEEFCSTPQDQWAYLNVDSGAFFNAPTTFVQCIPAKNLFDAYSRIAVRLEETDLKQKLLKVLQVPSDCKCMTLSSLLSTVYRLVVDEHLDKHRFCAFLATIVSQLDYSSQLQFFNAMLAICCEYRVLELSCDTVSESAQSIDLPMNSSTAFALTAWTVILPKNAQLSDLLEIIAQLYEFDSADVPHNSSVIDWSSASLCDLMLASLLRNTAMTAQFESLVDRGKIWMNKFKAMKPALKASLLKLLFQSIVYGVTARVALHRWFFEFQRQLLRAFMKDDSALVSRTVVSAIAALLGEVTSMTNGVLSPMCYNDNKLDLLLKFLLIYDDTCQQKESEQTPVAMILENMLKDPNALLVSHGLNLLSLLMFKNFLSIHKIKLDPANVVFSALESSPDNLLDCLIRLPHEPKTVVIAYDKAIGRALKSEKLKANKSLKLASERVKKALSNSSLDISILTSHNGNVNAFSFNVVEMFRSSPNDLKRMLSNIQSTDEGLATTVHLMDHLIGTVRKIQLTRERSNVDISRKDLSRLVSSLAAWKLAKWQELQLSLLPLPEELSNHVLQVLNANTTQTSQPMSLLLPPQPTALSCLFQSSIDWQDNVSPDEISFFGNQAVPRPPPSWTPWLLSPSLPSKNVKPLTTLRLEGIIKSYLDFVAGLPNLDLLTRFFVVSVLGSTDRLFAQALIDTAVNIESWLLDHVIVEECQVIFARLTSSNHPTTDEFYAPIFNLVHFLLKWPRSLWHNIFDSSFNRSISTDQSSCGLLYLLEFVEQHKADLSGCTDLCGRLQYCLSRPSIDTHVSLNHRWSALFKRVWKIDYTIIDPSTIEFGLLEWLDWELLAFTDSSWHLSQVSTTDLEAYHKRMVDTLTSRPVQHRRNKLNVDMESALKHSLLALLKYCVNSYQRHQYMECPKFITSLFDKLCQIVNNPNNTTVNHYPITMWLFRQFQQLESLAPVISLIDKILPHILLVPFTQTDVELKTWSEAWNTLYKRVQSHQVFARVLLISTVRGWCLRHSLLGASKGDKAKQSNLDEMLPTLIGVMREPAKSTIISQLSKDFSTLRDSKRSSAIYKSFKYFENKCSEIEPNEMVIDLVDHLGESRNPFVVISQSPTHKSRSLAQSSVDLPVSSPPSSAVSQSQNNTNVMSRLNRSLDLPIENSSPIRPQHQPRSTPPINPPTLPRTEHIQVALPKEDSTASIQMDIDIELSLPKELSEVNLDMSENDLFEEMTLTKSPKTKSSKAATKSPKTPAAKSKKTPTKSKSNNNRESSAEEVKEPAEKESEEKKDDSASVEIVLKKNTKSKTTPKSNTKKAPEAKSNNSDEKKSSVKSPAQKSKAKSPEPKPKTSAKKSPASKKQSAKKEESDASASEKSEKDQSKKDSESEKSEKSEKNTRDNEKDDSDKDNKSDSEKSDSSKSKKISRDEKSEQSAIKSSEESSKSSASRKASQKSESSDDSDSDEKSSSSKSSAKSSSAAKSSSSSAKSSSSSKSKKSASASEKSNSSSSRKSAEESDKEKSEKSESSSEKWATKKSKKSPPKKKPQRANGSTNAKKKSAKKKKPVATKQTKADDEEKSDENKKSNEESNAKTKVKKSNKNNAKESVSDEKTTSTNTKKTPTKDDDTKKPAAKETAPKAKKSKKNSLAKKEVDELQSAELIEEDDTRQSDNHLAPAPLKSTTAPLRTLSGLSQAITSSLNLPFSQDTIDLTVSTDVNGSVDGDCVVLSAQPPVDDDFQLTGSKRKRNDGQDMKPNKRSKAALGKVNTVQEITD